MFLPCCIADREATSIPAGCLTTNKNLFTNLSRQIPTLFKMSFSECFLKGNSEVEFPSPLVFPEPYISLIIKYAFSSYFIDLLNQLVSEAHQVGIFFLSKPALAMKVKQMGTV